MGFIHPRWWLQDFFPSTVTLIDPMYTTPFWQQVGDFPWGDNGDSYFGDASKLLTLPNGFLGIHPRKFFHGTYKSPRFSFGKSSEPNLHFWVPAMNFQGCTQNGPNNKPRWFTSHQTSTFGCCSCSDFQKACYPGRAAILSWWLQKRYLLWRYSRTLPNSLGVLYCNERYVDLQEHDISFSWRNLVYQLSPTSLLFLKKVTTSIPGVYTHTA